MCDDAIRANYEQLPTMFAERQQFENFRRSAEQEFLSVETFPDYKKSLDARMKTIEKRRGHRYTLNRHVKNGNSESKSYINLDTISSFASPQAYRQST